MCGPLPKLHKQLGTETGSKSSPNSLAILIQAECDTQGGRAFQTPVRFLSSILWSQVSSGKPPTQRMLMPKAVPRTERFPCPRHHLL